MNPLEIIDGFNSDPTDFTTACSNCHHRFEATLVNSRNAVCVEIPFYCAMQTLAMLPGKERLDIEHFRKEYPEIYHSVVVHHGGLRRAFEKIGVQYAFSELHDWKDKVRQFLGELPDTVIASTLDQPVRVIRRLRNRYGISPYRARDYAY